MRHVVDVVIQGHTDDTTSSESLNIFLYKLQ